MAVKIGDKKFSAVTKARGVKLIAKKPNIIAVTPITTRMKCKRRCFVWNGRLPFLKSHGTITGNPKIDVKKTISKGCSSTDKCLIIPVTVEKPTVEKSMNNMPRRLLEVLMMLGGPS